MQFPPPSDVIKDAAAQLQRRAFLHDDPDAYRAGVRDAFSALTAKDPTDTQPPADV